MTISHLQSSELAMLREQLTIPDYFYRMVSSIVLSFLQLKLSKHLCNYCGELVAGAVTITLLNTKTVYIIITVFSSGVVYSSATAPLLQ